MFGQRPLFLLTILIPFNEALATTISVLHQISYTASLMYFLMLVDALSYRSKELPWTFYIAKFIYGFIWLAASAYWVGMGKIEW
jgi:hypothetical protein